MLSCWSARYATLSCFFLQRNSVQDYTRHLKERRLWRDTDWVSITLQWLANFYLDHLSPPVNDLLKDQIAQMHAFSQVKYDSFILPVCVVDVSQVHECDSDTPYHQHCRLCLISFPILTVLTFFSIRKPTHQNSTKISLQSLHRGSIGNVSVACFLCPITSNVSSTIKVSILHQNSTRILLSSWIIVCCVAPYTPPVHFGSRQRIPCSI